MPPVDVTRFTRRLLLRWDRDCWIGLVVRAIPAARREIDGAIVSTPDHFLGAAWAPALCAPVRWPEAAVIGSPSSDNALAELFGQLPRDARLFLATPDDVDAALAAEILLAADRHLEAYQREALAAFIASARQRARSAIAARYTDCDAGYERFLGRVLGTRC